MSGREIKWIKSNWKNNEIQIIENTELTWLKCVIKLNEVS